MAEHPQDHRGCQTFRFLAWQWCIDTADALTRDNPQAAIFYPQSPITKLAKFLPLAEQRPGFIQLIRIDVNTAYAMTTDLTQPIIVAPLGSDTSEECGAIPIDGWHRIYHALVEGRTHLPMLLLTPETEQAARIPIWI